MPKFTFGVFSIDVPDGWRLSTMIFAGPLDEDPDDALDGAVGVRAFQKNLVVTFEEVQADLSVDDYLKRQMEGLTKAGVDWQLDKELETVQFDDGSKGIVSEQIVMGAGGELVRQMQLMRIKSGVACTLIASHQAGKPFDLARDDFRKMLLSMS